MDLVFEKLPIKAKSLGFCPNFESKEPYVYQGNEVIEFIDKEVAGAKMHTIIYWNDGDRTYAIKQDEGPFDYELSCLVCVAKKFLKHFNLDQIYENCKNVEGVKNILKQMLKVAGQKEAVDDIYGLIAEYKEYNKQKEIRERQLKKRIKRLEERKQRIEKLKREGKWVSDEDYNKAVKENMELKARKEFLNRAEEYKKILEENEKMRRELN